MNPDETLWIPKAHLQWSEVGSETVIVDRELGEVLRLNASAGSMWKLLGQEKTLSEIAQRISQEYNVVLDDSFKDAKAFIRHLRQLELIESRGIQDVRLA